MPQLTDTSEHEIIQRKKLGLTTRQISIETGMNRDTINKFVNKLTGTNRFMMKKKFDKRKKNKNHFKTDPRRNNCTGRRYH